MVRGADFFKIAKLRRDSSLNTHKQLHCPTGKFLRHAIFGMNDGLVSTLALVAGLVGATVGVEVILIAGFTEMIAGAISMSLGTYISTKSQIEFYKREIKREREDISKSPKLEKAHLKEIYSKKGFKGAELDKIVDKLTSDKNIWLDILVSEELGLSKSKIENPFISGSVMFFAFVFGAFIPISSFMLVPTPLALKFAIFSSLGILFFVWSSFFSSM